jgi:hypothetical protein
MDAENDPHLLKLALHHQLLSGAALYVHIVDVSSEQLDELDGYIVQGRHVLRVTGGMYKVRNPQFEHTIHADSPEEVERAFDRGWSAIASGENLHRLFYRAPYTFESSRKYRLEDFGPLLFEIQRGRCPCPDHCDLGSTQRWDVDHIVPSSRGGTNVLINLQVACPEYNREVKRAGRPVLRPDYIAAVANRCPAGMIPFALLNVLLNPQLTMQGVRQFERSVKSLARAMYGDVL